MARNDRLFSTANLSYYDANNDGKVTIEELTGKQNLAFKLLDKNNDCQIGHDEKVNVYSVAKPKEKEVDQANPGRGGGPGPLAGAAVGCGCPRIARRKPVTVRPPRATIFPSGIRPSKRSQITWELADRTGASPPQALSRHMKPSPFICRSCSRAHDPVTSPT